MSRLPIRVRLTLAFTVVMAVVLAATGLFLYLRQASALDNTLDQALRTRAADVATLFRQSDSGLREGRNAGPEGAFAEVLGTDRSVIDATPGLGGRPLLTTAQLAQARRGAAFFERKINDVPVRLYASPQTGQERQVVVVVGSSLEPNAETLLDLRRQMLIGGPIALVLASLAGYVLAAAALRPVERMSERAGTISAANPERRLPVPSADDEISRLGSRLNDMLARLQAALERERVLVSNASHELRTPLSLMKTEIELALTEPESAPALAAALRSAAEETDRLAQLTDDLLLLARADSGRLPLRRSDVPGKELLETISTRYARRAADAGRPIEVAVPANLVIRADRRRLEQALANLVENALRHGAGPIRLEAAGGEETIELRVADGGPGFPPQFVGHAFERFSRADSARETPGAGLGLAIVAAIAEAHGGTATISDAAGRDAVVAIRLPAQDTLLPTRSER